MYVTLVTPENKQLFAKELDRAYCLRHEIFNEWMGWDLPHQNGREIDKYDEDCLYLLAFEEDHTMVGTWRLMPTTMPYLTAEVFPELLDEIGLVSRRDAWELSRFAIDREYYGRNKVRLSRLLASMASAVYEFGIMNGVSEFLSVQNRQITAMANRMLGDPIWKSCEINAGATEAACYSYAPTMERLYALRTQFRLNVPVLSQFQVTALQAAA